MSSSLITKNIRVHQHRTSVRLEPQLWAALEEISRRENKSTHDLCAHVASVRSEIGGFTSALRVYVLGYFREQLHDMEHRFVSAARAGNVSADAQPRAQRVRV